MKKHRFLIKFLSVLLIFIFALSSVYAVDDSAAADIAYPEQAITVLSSLGLIDSAGYEAQGQAFTRGELAQKLVTIMNLEDTVWSSVLPFADVPTGHENYTAIGKCVSQGVLGGYSSTSFKPDQNATVIEVVTTLMRALGYQNIAELRGGYAAGYSTQASLEGLLDGISSGVMNTACTNWMFARMVYNMLDIEVYRVAGFDGSYPLLERGEAYMTETFDIVKEEGVLDGTRITSIKTGESCRNGYVTIDSVLYRNNGVNLDNYLGYGISAYYMEELGETPVILYAELSDAEAVKKIAKEDITELSGSAITYYEAETGRTRTLTIPQDAYLLYNNRPANSLVTMTGDGYYICIDNDEDGDVDVVRIEEYQSLFIDSVNTKEGRIYDEYNPANNMFFNPNEVGESVFIYDEDGEAIDLDGLETGIVYSCIRSENDETIVIQGVINEVVGLVSSGAKDENGYYEELTVGDTTVKISESIRPYLTDITIGKTNLIGYLDIMGKLAAFDDVTGSGKKFAYLSGVAEGTGMSGSLLLQMHVAGSAKGEFTVYECADTVKIDAITYKLTADMGSIYQILTASVGKVITFELNKAEKLSFVGTIDGGSLISVGSGETDTFYDSRIGNVGIASTTMVIFVPGSGDAKDFRSGSRSSLVRNTSYQNYEGYITDTDKIAAEVLVTTASAGSGSLGGDAPHMVITETSTIVMDEDGVTGTRVTGYVLGVLQTFTMPDDADCYALSGEALTGVKAGDVVRYSADSSNVLNYVQVLYSLDGDTIYGSNPSNSDIYGKPRVLRAKAYKMDGDYILFSYADPEDPTFNEQNDTELRCFDSCKGVYIYDKNARSGQQVTLASKKDILSYWKHGSVCSDLFAVTRGELMETVVILKQ